MELIHLQWLGFQKKALTFLMLRWWQDLHGMGWDAPFIWEMFFHVAYHWRNWKPCIIVPNFLHTNRGCSFEIKGAFVRDSELDLQMRQNERQNEANESEESKEKKNCANKSSVSRTKRLANQHQYQIEKNAYSSTSTDEIRKYNSCYCTFALVVTSCGINTVSSLLKTLDFPILL